MSEERKYLRFTISDRFEHWLQMASFTILALTGLVQKFSKASLSIFLVDLLGGIESVRVIHRIGAIGLMLGTIYHFGSLGYKIYVKRSRLDMLPTFDDAKAAWELFLYNLGKLKRKPQQGRYTFDEKFEYWAFVWGTLVMGISGFMLWNPILATKYLPGVFIPASKAAHSGEALLAVLAIIIWHFYNVHFKHFNKSMFTGYLSEKEMLEEHPLELADIKAGLTASPFSEEKIAKREKIFYPSYSVLAAIMLVGVYFFINVEDTAIKTITPLDAQVEAYAPLPPTPFPTPPPTPISAPVQGNTWEAGIGDLFDERCGLCHGGAAPLGGLDVSTYKSITASEEMIVPGDTESGLIISVQASGEHGGLFNNDELDLIREWIEAGIPEN